MSERAKTYKSEFGLDHRRLLWCHFRIVEGIGSIDTGGMPCRRRSQPNETHRNQRPGDDVRLGEGTKESGG
jgi:hypothetical protein